MPAELCPKCGAARNLAVSTSHKEEVGPDGEIKKIMTTSYHCETCGMFVRSEVLEEAAGSNNAIEQ